MIRPSKWSLIIAAAIITTACTTLKDISIAPSEENPAPAKDLNVSAEADDVKVEIKQIIQPGDPSSWVENARWTELVVQIFNKSDSDISIHSAKLLDQRGRLLSPLSNLLYKQDREQQNARMQETQLGYGLAQQAVTETTRQPYSYSSGWGAVGSILSQSLSFAQQHTLLSLKTEPEKIRREAEARSLPNRALLIRGGSIEGSLFFEHVKDPQLLFLEYQIDNDRKEIQIALVDSPNLKGRSVLQGRSRTVKSEISGTGSALNADQADKKFGAGTGDLAYAVKAGDSLSTIAERFTGRMENWNQIAAYNRITDPAKLREGQEIKIPAHLRKDNVKNVPEKGNLPVSRSFTHHPQRHDGQIEVSLEEVIITNGPGSWIEGASWNEYVIQITNIGSEDVTIDQIDLIDSRGVYVPRKHLSGYEVSQVIKKQREAVAESRAAECLPLALLNFSALWTRGAAPLAPQPDYCKQKAVTLQDQEQIQDALNNRSLPPRIKLGAGGSVTGSVFFPTAQNPQSIVLTYRTGMTMRSGSGVSQVKLPLGQ